MIGVKTERLQNSTNIGRNFSLKCGSKIKQDQKHKTDKHLISSPYNFG